MNSSAQFLSPSEAAKRLGVSAKALRLYEERGLVAPVRTEAGWRTYGPREMGRVAEVVALRALGLSLAQISRVLDGDPRGLEPALAVHQVALEDRIRQIAGAVERVRGLRADLAKGRAPGAADLTSLLGSSGGASVVFNLPWPWGGEPFELNDIRALNFIVGPLGSGKTRLARSIAEALPGAAFLELDRLADGGAAARAQIDADPALRSRIDRAIAWLIEDGAVVSDALLALLVGLEAEGPAWLVVDVVEQGLEQAAQEALMAYLRSRASEARPFFLLTRSSAILDLAAVGADEAIILCPANHSPPTRVAPYPGAPGYEAVATCLASPDVRARSAAVVPWRPRAA